jgi:trimethylamine--corrinoid protein Co-methyltransferase
MDIMNVTMGDDDRDGAAEALATISDIEPGGHFLGTAHTLGHYPFQPELQDYNTFEQWDEEGRVNTDERGRRHAIALLEAYEAPPIDPAIDEELGEFVERRSRELEG